MEDQAPASAYLTSSCVLLKWEKSYSFFKWTYNCAGKKGVKQKNRKSEGKSKRESKYGQMNKENEVVKTALQNYSAEWNFKI